jgi:hypothetical protein
MNSFFATLILAGCVGLGMFLGAWFATRGFEKAMSKMAEEGLSINEIKAKDDVV